MQLKEGAEGEYIRRHQEVWPELANTLSGVGISDFSIFLDNETLSLVAVQKLADDNTVDQLRESEVVQKWWAYMADLMETNADNSPISVPLREVFHLE